MNEFLREFNEYTAVVSFVIQLSLIVLVSFILRWFWKNVLIRLARKTTTNLDIILFESTGGPAQITFIAAGLSFTWKLYGKAIIEKIGVFFWINTDFLEKLLDHFCFFFLAFSIIFLVWKTIFALFKWFEKDIAVKTETTLDEKIAFSLRKIIKTCFFIFGAIIIADRLELPLSKLWAAAGIGSLAIALAAQETIANLISGVIILLDRPFLTGDRIELLDGTFGDVVDIGLRSTKIISLDNTIYIIPNAIISSQRITNHSYPDYKLKVSHNIGVAYGSDMEKVKKVIEDILREHPKVLNNPVWGIWFMEFGDSSLNFLIRYWIRDYKNKFIIMDEINMEINNKFEEEHIEIPFPQTDVHIFNKGKTDS